MKANYYCILKENVMDMPEFHWKNVGSLGTHSTRKYGMTQIPPHHYIAGGENSVTKHCCIACEQGGITHIGIIDEEGIGDTSKVASGRLLGSAEASP
eukprot:15332856-Ditylum_brightwellii.AAC.1